MLAAITMLIDHIAAGVLIYWLNGQTSMTVDEYLRIYNVYDVMRNIGRLAFPIYCYMLVEGFFHTRNIKKYILRLFIAALVSEIPFDLLFTRSAFSLEKNNVLWTLLTGLLAMYIMEKIKGVEINNIIVKNLARVLIMLIGMTIAYYCHFDYKASGVAAICAIYYLYGNTRDKRLFALAVAIAILAFMSSTSEVYALVLLVPFYFYEGEKGGNSLALRRFFYAFYPVHLAVLYVISLFVLK